MFSDRQLRKASIVALVVLPAIAESLVAAQAASKLAWVSSSGRDIASCGSTASPCLTLQYAHNVAVLANGVIAIRDSGEFGPLTITRAVSVINDGAGTAMISNIAPGGSAITIRAGASDKVVLRGLTLDGGGAASNGIVFVSGASLSIEKCATRNFVSSGIALGPTTPTRLHVSDSVTENNGGYGLYLQPRTTAAVNFYASFIRVQAINNALNGFGVYGNFAPDAAVFATIADSAAVNNRGAGYHALGQGAINVSLSLVRSTAEGNGSNFPASDGAAALVDTGARILASEMNLDANPIRSWRTKGSGEIWSYGDNLTGAVASGVSIQKK